MNSIYDQNLTPPAPKVKAKNPTNPKTCQNADLRILAREIMAEAGILTLLTAEMGSQDAALSGFLENFEGLVARFGG